MSTRQPQGQTRTQYGRDFGNYASLEALPNAPGYTGSADAVSMLEAGDRAYATNIGPAYCVSAGTPGGLDAVWAPESSHSYQGFQTADLANYYQVPAADAGACPGADDFIVVVLVSPFVLRSAFADIIVQSGAWATGWRFEWNAGNLRGLVFSTGPTGVDCVTGSTYVSDVNLGHMHAIALRVFQNGGNTDAQLWLGPAVVAVSTGPATVIPSVGDQMLVGSGTSFGDERALNGGIYGLGYFEGTATDDQMRALMGRCIAEQAIPYDALAWDNLWLGATVVGAPATWPATAGAVDLERVAAPTGSAAYFPPV